MPTSRTPQILRAAVAAAALLVPVQALAHPTFPGVLQEEYALECPPSCLLCHTRIEGGTDFVKQDTSSFVQNLKFVGEKSGLKITSDNADQFKKLLVTYATWPCDNMPGGLPCDSDGDGVSDSVELAKGEDPERAGKPLPDCVLYGCGAHIAPKAATSRNVSGFSASAVCVALGALFVFARRRSRA